MHTSLQPGEEILYSNTAPSARRTAGAVAGAVSALLIFAPVFGGDYKLLAVGLVGMVVAMVLGGRESMGGYVVVTNRRVMHSYGATYQEIPMWQATSTAIDINGIYLGGNFVRGGDPHKIQQAIEKARSSDTQDRFYF